MQVLRLIIALVVLLGCHSTTTTAFVQPTVSIARSAENNRQGRLLCDQKSRHNNNHNKNRQSLATQQQQQSDAADNNNKADVFFDGRTTFALVGGQSLLILGSIAVAALVGTPRFGLGPGFDLSWSAVGTGVLLTLPLGILAALLDLVEERFQALKDVTKATQRSVLALLGGEFKPVIALVTSLALGCVAGLGEEMLFRGVLQFELSARFGEVLAIGLSSVIFGLLHAVTPLYAILATLASVYFGAIYIWSSNLAVPIVTHAFYDLVALLFAHWTVSRLSEQEQQSLSLWKGPGDV
ncbi:CAAX protease self-immunity [Seminavis robusta]|uniref:CAAX protease self-immunity n=1 Tax=Seminavis robusta TaxID=568900 RepID=A0A9N8F0C1_9STRA|nr:CAAX protease self-immunity [Seminavis robusta]|eukprot:Sro2196_g318620.1 CAAX protease self-immunity (296) ;mRNA; r:12013-12900